jgi:hypothetical protein
MGWPPADVKWACHIKRPSAIGHRPSASHQPSAITKKGIEFANIIPMLVRHSLLLIIVVGCTGVRAAETAPASVTDSDRAFASYVAQLRESVLKARAQLDSSVAQLHRVSGDGSASSVSRATQLLRSVSLLDSTYRARLADLLWTVNSSSGTSSIRRDPVALPQSPLLQPFADGEDWMLLSPMIAKLGNGNPMIVIVPRGFVTDYASIPKPLRLLLPTNGAYGNAAVIHDYLYWRQDCTRSQSDNIMAIAMKDAGVPSSQLRAIHIGVRIGGQGSWDGNRRARDSGLVRTVGPPFDQVPPGTTWDAYREWIHTHKGIQGVEYAVPQRVCAMGDSVSFWN